MVSLISSISLNFNFHHRVVETWFISSVSQSPSFFNFHHRVVETDGDPYSFLINISLTFTIGWLKQFEEWCHMLLKRL